MGEAARKITREMPNSLTSEAALLGSIFLRPNSIEEIFEIVKPGDFYRSAHRIIYEAMVALFQKGEAIDVLTVSDRLETKKQLDQAGGLDTLSELAEIVPTSHNIKSYAAIIAEKAQLRQLVEAGYALIDSGYSENQGVKEIIEQSENRIFEIGQREIRSTIDPVAQVVTDSLKNLQDYFEKGSGVTGVSTGFEKIDELTNGLQPGELTVIAARPSMGKSALALNIASNVVLAQDARPVALFTLEMSNDVCGMRLLASLARVDLAAVRRGEANENDFYSLTKAGSKLYEAPFFIDDTGYITTDEIRAKCRRLKARHGGLGLVVVDYIQLLKPRGNIQSREQQVSDFSRSLKSLAKELSVPVIALSQLNRAVENRDNKRPRLADIRESGAVEQDADMIFFIYRGEYYNPDDPELLGKAEINLSKNRNGPTGVCHLAFHNRFARFENLAEDRY